MATSVPAPCTQAAIEAAQSARCAPGAGPWVLAAAILGSSLAFIDSTAVNVALPALQTELHATIAGVQWVVEAYALFLAALVLTGGALGDRYGRRRTFALGTVIFTAASVWCGLAPNLAQLVAARSLQGVGAALLVPGSLALISVAFAPQSRGAAIGTWSGATSITAAIGPVLGGWLVQHGSWRWVFFINVPIAAAVLALVAIGVPESKAAEQHQPLDWPGALLAALGLGGVVFALLEASRPGLQIWTAAILGLACLVAFVGVEARAPAPTLPLALFRSRDFSGANLITLLLYAGLGGVLFFFPLNLIQVQGYSATAAGAALLPFILLMALLSRWSGGLVRRHGPRPPLIIGPVVTTGGFVLLALSGVGGSYWTTFMPGILVLGLGMAISVAPLTTTVMNAVDQDRAGAASGVNNAVARVASLLAVAVLGLVLVGVFHQTLARQLERTPLAPAARALMLAQSQNLAATPASNPGARAAIAAAFVAGFRAIVWISAAMALLSALIAALLLTGAPLPPPPRPAGGAGSGARPRWP